MKRLALSTFSALCGLMITTTAHASFVERSFQKEPEWRTQQEVDATSEVRLDARTAVPNEEAKKLETHDFNDADKAKGDAMFGSKLLEVTVTGATPVTRAEFTAILVHSRYNDTSIKNCFSDIAPVLPPSFELLFRDVAVTDAYAPEICVAMRDGLIRGYGNDTFRPGATISFADAAKVVARTHGLTPWADQSKPEHWFDIYVSALARRNAIPMSITKIEQRITADEAREMMNRLQKDDRTQESRTADELIATWKKANEKPRRPAMTITVAPKPTTGSSAAMQQASSKPKAPIVKAKSSASTKATEENSSRPKAWYEF